MTIQPETQLSVPDRPPSMLKLPRPLTLESIDRIEETITSLLRALRQDLSGNTQSDPGSLEVDSWSIQRH